MRQLVNAVAVVTGLGLIGGIAAWQGMQLSEEQKVQEVQEDVRRFQQQVSLRAAVKNTETNERGFPATIEPGWFGNDPPRNALLSQNRPWVEVARPEEAELLDPVTRIAIDDRTAQFWYNPYQGVVRARVPVTVSDRRGLELYNRLNGTDLDNLFQTNRLMVSPRSAGRGVEKPASRVTAATVDEGKPAE